MHYLLLEIFFLAWEALFFIKCLLKFIKYFFIEAIFWHWRPLPLTLMKCLLHFLKNCLFTAVFFLAWEAFSFIKFLLYFLKYFSLIDAFFIQCLLQSLQYCFFTEALLKWEAFSFKTASLFQMASKLPRDFSTVHRTFCYHDLSCS